MSIRSRFLLGLLMVVVLGSLVGCRILNPSGSDDNSAAVTVTSQSLVIPVVVPASEVATATLTALPNILAADLATDLTLNVVINGVAKSLGKPKYWAPQGTASVVLFYAETPANLGLTDTSVIGTFSLVFQTQTLTIPAGRLSDLLVNAPTSITLMEIVGGVAKAMGFATTQAGAPTITATIPRITVVNNYGDLTATPERLPISGGTPGTAQPIGTGTTISGPVTVITMMEAKPGQEYAARLALLEVVKASRLEPGCISYDLYQGNNASIFGSWGVATAPTGKFVEVQKFSSMAALGAHVTTPHVGAMFAKAGDYFVTAPGQATPFIAANLYGTEGPNRSQKGMLTYVGILNAATGYETKVREAMLEIVKQTRANEAGIMRYDLFRGAFDTASTNWVILQSYQDAIALQTHLAAAYFQAFMTGIAQTDANARNEGFFVNMVSEPAAPAPLPVLASTNVVVATYMKAKPGMTQAAKLALMNVVSTTRKEAGCLGYDLFQGNDGTFNSQGFASLTTDIFVLRETWKDFSAIGFHCSTNHFLDFWAKANYLFETPAGEAGPFRVTFALIPATQENPGTIGLQRVALISAKPAFDTNTDNFYSLIRSIRGLTSWFISYEAFKGDGNTGGTATSSMIIWERFVKPVDGSSLWTPVSAFLASQNYKDLVAAFLLTLDMASIKGTYLDYIDCPPYTGVQIQSNLMAPTIAPLTAPPADWPGF